MCETMLQKYRRRRASDIFSRIAGTVVYFFPSISTHHIILMARGGIGEDPNLFRWGICERRLSDMTKEETIEVLNTHRVDNADFGKEEKK